MRKLKVTELYWDVKQGKDVERSSYLSWHDVGAIDAAKSNVEELVAIHTENHAINLYHLAPKASFHTSGKSIISLLSGNLAAPFVGDRPMRPMESGLYESTPIVALDESIVCVARVEENGIRVQERPLGFVYAQFNERVSRSNPKLWIRDADGGNDISVRMNLWYGEPNCDMGIHNHMPNPDDYHNDEPFMREWHVLLRGSGWMVKYREQDKNTEYSRFAMQIGQTHPLFCERKGGREVYPWHAWETGPDGSLFIAFEDLVDHK